ncbi:hypothetical protein EYC80_007478 [Monilinia laxa]|uniref:NADH dehydrogenase [ubiquinone] 1 beta subcomplex subunit 9 n=1 Tax=Monilinia laxa TaxID=61186 RepID=A0A5N6JW08_MONLA|nr:hypothetical protein EYC80_007478 [Monilinia laxa]
MRIQSTSTPLTEYSFRDYQPPTTVKTFPINSVTPIKISSASAKKTLRLTRNVYQSYSIVALSTLPQAFLRLAQKNVHDPRLQRALFKETEDLLEKWKHPDPYRPPTAPGGSKYERNLPAPILDPPPKMVL